MEDLTQKQQKDSKIKIVVRAKKDTMPLGASEDIKDCLNIKPVAIELKSKVLPSETTQSQNNQAEIAKKTNELTKSRAKPLTLISTLLLLTGLVYFSSSAFKAEKLNLPSNELLASYHSSAAQEGVKQVLAQQPPAKKIVPPPISSFKGWSANYQSARSLRTSKGTSLVLLPAWLQNASNAERCLGADQSTCLPTDATLAKNKTCIETVFSQKPLRKTISRVSGYVGNRKDKNFKTLSFDELTAKEQGLTHDGIRRGISWRPVACPGKNV